MKNFSKTLLITSVLLITGVMNAQNAIFSWAGQYNTDSSGSSETIDMFSWQTSITQQIVSAGNFHGTVDFDLSSGQDIHTSQGGSDVWISLIDEVTQSTYWTITLGSSGNEKVTQMGKSDDNNILVSGSFSGTVDFDPGTGVVNLTSAGGTDGFLMKIDYQTGTLLWAMNVAEGTGNDQCQGFFVKPNTNIAIAGTFENTCDLNPGTGVSNVTAAGGTDFFVSVLTSVGGYINSTSAGSTNNESVYDVVVGYGDRVVVNGGFYGTLDIDPSAAVQTITSTDTAMYIVSLDSSLNYYNHGKLTTSKFVTLAYDYSSYRIVLCGAFKDSITRNVGGTGPAIYSMGGWDGFALTLFDNLNSTVEAYRFGGIGDDYVTAASTDGYRLALAGTTSSVLFTVLETANDTLQITGTGNDMFGISLEHVSGFVESYGLSSNLSGTKSAKDALTKYTAQGFAILLAGSFSNTSNFSPQPGQYSMNASAPTEGFIAYWGACATIYSFTNVLVCDTFYIYNNLSYSVPGVIVDTFATACGADSIITITLGNSYINPAVTVSNLTLTAAQAGINYQWVDCNAGYTPINGANLQSFTPTVAGSYAVILTALWCSVPDTSACTVVDVGLQENNTANIFISPNPFSDQIIMKDVPANSTITILSALGQIVFEEQSVTGVITVNTSSYDCGVYFIRVSNNHNSSTFKVQK